MDEIKQAAKERGAKKGLSYAGELLPAEAGHPVWGPLFRSLKGKE